MQTDWIWALAGGLLIGLGGAVYLLCNGRIMGASGILGGLLDGSGKNTAAERLAFLAGVVLVPLAVSAVTGQTPDTHVTSSIAVLAGAGLLVGLGTRIGNGCTSGHGVCGISRLSRRGIAATALFMLAGVLTLAVLRHLWGLI